ncbi:photosystem II reaction center protein Psb28 [Pseudanabaena sp. PCC 6802]|uniref:photosystem II reaction center protein Psb28 n=1 Tax=Pseudanabaena sp. PCC 6802 TaxID=118173 RepID=UPI00034631FA|nr:photosystem II reaction center protein Psb28 [Pseudanabaena sp. PCC 6802]
MSTSVQFIDGLNEEISSISLRKRRSSNAKIVVLFFNRLAALEKGRSFTNNIEMVLLRDEEGDIQVSPRSMKFKFDDDELVQAECSFEVDSDGEWDRVMRFFHRYAEDHNLEFSTPS